MSKKTKTKVKIGIFAGLYSLFILVLVTLLLEGLGTFVGYIIDRPFAASYIDKNYSDIKCKFVKAELINEKRTVLGVEQNYKSYRFSYEVKSMEENHGVLEVGDIFSIDAYNFKVTRDSIYMEYNQDTDLLEEANQLFVKDIDDFTLGNYDIEFDVIEAYIDMKIPQYTFSGIDELLESDLISESDAVIHVVGKQCTYEKYKKIIAPFILYFQQENKSVPNPNNVQIFYYYIDYNGEKVMEYETELENYQLELSEETIAKAEDMHYKVELTEDEEKKANFYNIFKIVYICVLGGTVIALYSLFTFRKIKKLNKELYK